MFAFDKSHIVKLTVVLYKVSDFFPGNEPLRSLTREMANDILAGLVLANNFDKIIGKIEALAACLEVAKNLNWAKSETIDLVINKYQSLENILKDNLKSADKKPLVEKTENKAPKNENNDIDLNNKRRAKIVEILKKGKTLQVKDMETIFPNVSKRTLRRDFEYLFSRGVVERIGDNNNTMYKLRGS